MPDSSLDARIREVEITVGRIETAMAESQKATQLQAKEYERRLDTLNHAHEKAVEVQHTYVTAEKYEATLKAEAQAREIALTRIDERFEEFVTRYEARQREVDILIAAQEGAAEEAKRAASKAEQNAIIATQEATHKTNRNLTILGILVGVIIAIANGAGPF